MTDAQQKNLQEYIELLRSNVRQQKDEIMGAVMALNVDQAAKFWPIVGAKGTHLTLQHELNQLPVIPADQNPFLAGQPITDTICNSQAGSTLKPTFRVDGKRVRGQPAINLAAWLPFLARVRYKSFGGTRRRKELRLLPPANRASLHCC